MLSFLTIYLCIFLTTIFLQQICEKKMSAVLCVFHRSVVEKPNMHNMIIPGRKRAVKTQAAQPLGLNPYPFGGRRGVGYPMYIEVSN